ncbi:cell morphogenesis protein Sog2 [Blastomyces gilchristii SLH14081]|uniref:Cell morphogenesis protein Sog2 n=1 Tax=Blastomyces gilchristii (strain SLH14081) TaxID=559298 RepID=A0A179UF93_BLAGS|nr:RAM signalling pathway protein domain-containing protein [Blastomyces gilchristii SLH14081]OAT06423.1 cell morphogenesis protein Sog2 [Blastomyces gilchristii SLH14081]
MLGIMTRTEDTTRPLRSYRSDTNEDTKEFTYPPVLPASFEPSIRGDTRSQSHRKILGQEETLELIKRAVENGLQETKRSLAGSEAVDDVVRPKLTIDLGHSNIGWIPESMVDIIKDEVARLSLSNNHIDHIPLRFSECTHLRYLNIRANNFTQFPKGVFNLNLLEILDLSRNKITKIPEDIRNLTSLRVLSIMQNLLDDLPTELADMTKLQVLKVSGNALKYPLKRVLELKETDVSASEMTDNEKETAITAELKIFLKNRQPVTHIEFDVGSESSETLVDTPKPLKRGNRFPVIPRTNGSESAHSSRSPSLSRPPPIPIRSHHRMASGQNGVLHLGVNSRSGFAPFSGTNERNRSNSEGLIAGPGASRNRRMGLITRKNTDLGTLDEGRPYRNSHLRGLSHGSILRSKPGGMPGGGSSSSSPGSPRDRRKLKDGFVRRMSSLPEHRVKVRAQDPIIEVAKGILYALYQLHPHVSLLIHVLKGEDARRNSLEIVFYNAATHLEQLDDALTSAEQGDLQDAEGAIRACEVVKRECETCIMAYIHVGTQLRLVVSRAVSLGDPKFLRSLLLMIFGSLTELRNACSLLGISFHSEQSTLSGKMNRASSSIANGEDPVDAGESIATPTRDRHPPTRRLRSDTTIVHPIVVPNSNDMTYQRSNQSTTPAQFNAPYTVPSVPMSPLNYGARSRSRSRSNTRLASGPSSLANTPRSVETFGAINTSSSGRVNTFVGLDEVEVDRIFEKIFIQLSSACTAALHALPLVARQFTQYLELAEETGAPEELQMLWRRLIHRCRVCHDVSESLHNRLSNMKLKEPGDGTRNQRDFWQLCKTFIQAFIELVTDMREARNFHLLNPEVVITLRPVQKACREAGRLIDASPWSYLAELNTSNPTPFYPPHSQTHHFQHFTNSSTSTMLSVGSTLTNGSSQSVPLPATPLSAALGPAAQATVPSTPASAYSDRFFAGDVFQRADSLLNTANPAPIFARR